MCQDQPQVVARAAQRRVHRVAEFALEPVLAEQPVGLHVSDHRLDYLAPPEQLLQSFGQPSRVADQQPRATHDATALHISMRLPETDAPQPNAWEDILLASAALYGLRRASVAGPEQQGLTLQLDITAQAIRLRPLLLASANAPLILVIRTRPALPAGVTISIARACIACPRQSKVRLPT